MTLIEPIPTTQTRSLGTAPPRRGSRDRRSWTGADMRRRESEWTYRLSAAEIAEIEQATREVRARGPTSPRSPATISRCRRSGRCSTGCARGGRGRGFVRLRGMPVADRPIEESATAYWGIGTYFGKARSQNAKGHLLGHVYDLGTG